LFYPSLTRDLIEASNSALTFVDGRLLRAAAMPTASCLLSHQSDSPMQRKDNPISAEAQAAVRLNPGTNRRLRTVIETALRDGVNNSPAAVTERRSRHCSPLIAPTDGGCWHASPLIRARGCIDVFGDRARRPHHTARRFRSSNNGALRSVIERCTYRRSDVFLSRFPDLRIRHGLAMLIP